MKCCHRKIPAIAISEVSRLLVNLRKDYIKTMRKIHGSKNLKSGYDQGWMGAIQDVRRKLELRRRGRS